MGKRGSVSVLNEKRKKQFNKYWDWTWTDQFKWERPEGYAKELQEELNLVRGLTGRDKVRLNIVNALLTIAAEGLWEECQGLTYETWDVVLGHLGFTDKMKKVLIEDSNSTGGYNEFGQFRLDWNQIREGAGLVLCGTKTMKIRWEVLYRWVGYFLGKPQ